MAASTNSTTQVHATQFGINITSAGHVVFSSSHGGPFSNEAQPVLNGISQPPNNRVDIVTNSTRILIDSQQQHPVVFVTNIQTNCHCQPGLNVVQTLQYDTTGAPLGYQHGPNHHQVALHITSPPPIPVYNHGQPVAPAMESTGMANTELVTFGIPPLLHYRRY